VKQARDKLFAADKELTKEELESDIYKGFLASRQDLIARAREKILAIFPTQQRDKVEKFLATPRGFRGRRGGFGDPRPPGAPRPPAAPAPAAPANPQ